MSLTLFCPLPLLAIEMAGPPASGPRRPERNMSPETRSDPSDDRNREDARLMGLIARGNKAAFAEIYDRFSRPLFATALRIVGDRAEAQDIIHDAFIALWGNAATFDATRGSAFGWAVTLVRNRSIDRLRMRRRRAQIVADATPADLGYDENPPPTADSAGLGDQARAVRAAVASLPVEQKRALELAFFGGLTQQEIAAKLAEPLGTVKARIRRGLLKLRDALPRRL